MVKKKEILESYERVICEMYIEEIDQRLKYFHGTPIIVPLDVATPQILETLATLYQTEGGWLVKKTYQDLAFISQCDRVPALEFS